MIYNIADYWRVDGKIFDEECEDMCKLFQFDFPRTPSYWEWILFVGHAFETARLVEEMM